MRSLSLSTTGLFISLGLICVAACSSIDRVRHYNFEREGKNKDPKLTYERTGVHDTQPSAQGLPLKLVYKKKWRIFKVSDYQHATLSFKEYGFQTYMWGPPLLPILPNLWDYLKTHKSVNEDAKLQFSLSFASDPIFGSVKAKLPDLEITLENGKRLKPQVEIKSESLKIFTYDSKIRDARKFILHRAELRLSDGTTVEIPETRFALESEFDMNLVIPFAP